MNIGPIEAVDHIATCLSESGEDYWSEESGLVWHVSSKADLVIFEFIEDDEVIEKQVFKLVPLSC